MRRRVLVVYDSTDPYNNTPDRCPGFRLLGKPLNHLGMALDVHDVNQRPWPSLTETRAIVIWFDDQKMKEADAYLQWLRNAQLGKVRLLVFGRHLGATQTADGQAADDTLRRSILKTLGIESGPGGLQTDNPFANRPEHLRKDAFGFETTIPPESRNAADLGMNRATDDSVRVWKQLRNKDKTNVMIATSPGGGWVAQPSQAIRTFPDKDYEIRWDLNPFLFLNEALGCGSLPRPDVTTTLGNRAAFAHIDGDGQINMPQDLPGAMRERYRYASEVIEQEIIATYPLPITVSLVVARADPAAEGLKENIPLWRRLLMHPNVEAACHGYTHPMNWYKGTVGIPLKGHPFDEALETVKAMEFIRTDILQGKKPVDTFLWTGDCRPRPSAIRLLRKDGRLNMNGGDPCLDKTRSSISYLCPLLRLADGEIQVYAAAQNEYLYTEGWTTNFGGFARVLETFERTAAPRRLLPVNIYYHFYIGERQAGLRSLKQIYDWVMTRPLCWMYGSEYIRSVLAFQQARILQNDKSEFALKNAKHLRTLRFDKEIRHVAMDSARGVLGYSHWEGQLFVHLDGSGTARFHLGEKTERTPSVYTSTALLKSVRRSDTRWEGEVRCFAPGKLILQGWPPATRLTCTLGEATQTITSSATGQAAIALPQGRGQWRKVAIGL